MAALPWSESTDAEGWTAKPRDDPYVSLPRTRPGRAVVMEVVQRPSLCGWARHGVGPGQVEHRGQSRQAGQRSSPGTPQLAHSTIAR
jgi:hypothetical protein